MALDTTKIMVGAPVFSIGDYVTAGGAGTLVDVGDHLSPIEQTKEYENFDVETERSTGIVATYPIKSGDGIVVSFAQAEVEWLRIAQRQPSANKSGTGANLTLRVGDAVAQYHQATAVVPGPGTTAVRTLTWWRLQVSGMEPIRYGKAVVQEYKVTFRALKDTTVSTADKYWKIVDA